MGTYHIVPEWRRTVPETWIMLLICIQSKCCSKIWDTSADQTPFFCDVCCAAHARITNRYELCERGVFLDGSHTRQSDYTRQPNPNRIWKVAGQGGWPDWRTNNARSLCCGVMGDWGWLDHGDFPQSWKIYCSLTLSNWKNNFKNIPNLPCTSSVLHPKPVSPSPAPTVAKHLKETACRHSTAATHPNGIESTPRCESRWMWSRFAAPLHVPSESVQVTTIPISPSLLGKLLKDTSHHDLSPHPPLPLFSGGGGGHPRWCHFRHEMVSYAYFLRFRLCCGSADSATGWWWSSQTHQRCRPARSMNNEGGGGYLRIETNGNDSVSRSWNFSVPPKTSDNLRSLWGFDKVLIKMKLQYDWF